MATDCHSLTDTGLRLSSTNVTSGSRVNVSCDEFGHRPSNGIYSLTCLSTGNWSHAIPRCEWSWDLNTEEKIIFGTSIAAVSFIIVVVVAIFIAYFCCYRKRRENDERLYDSSYNGSSPRTGCDGPYERESYPVTYLAYQDNQDGKYDGFASTGTIDKPWLGYIPRPKVSEGRLYH
ncbi:uncharacterized protein LOC131931422 [Physella acuta]|uniref:uncharacterized protein LOC131931422 n=1 Tax=Physella acuta TaxID=109671 RepID=UPI0027DC966E|nr:uncharacterized protein LOC131931422 [Physella acuta]XP_059144202.1 uncharacterized protein LOC131931422 [Physella acuta]XP_059144203.1 uncharacterized protein LOC131931422 [Physella acuta]XP_059144204.1 uncharacterized protein LOC131931422 [Physella acuta]XP_059144205.1 uncharacterized protein LOC131931422 [Physella acuta]